MDPPQEIPPAPLDPVQNLMREMERMLLAQKAKGGTNGIFDQVEIPNLPLLYTFAMKLEAALFVCTHTSILDD